MTDLTGTSLTEIQAGLLATNETDNSENNRRINRTHNKIDTKKQPANSQLRLSTSSHCPFRKAKCKITFSVLPP